MVMVIKRDSELWKKAKDIPIFKKDKKENSENYRPISFILIPRKDIIIVLEIISKHVKDRKVVGSSHCGFIKGRTILNQPDSLLQ